MTEILNNGFRAYKTLKERLWCLKASCVVLKLNHKWGNDSEIQLILPRCLCCCCQQLLFCLESNVLLTPKRKSNWTVLVLWCHTNFHFGTSIRDLAVRLRHKRVICYNLFFNPLFRLGWYSKEEKVLFVLSQLVISWHQIYSSKGHAVTVNKSDWLITRNYTGDVWIFLKRT